MAWKVVGVVFQGGSQAAQALYGKRIKVLRPLELPSFQVSGQGKPIALRAGEEGFVGNVPPGLADHIVLAFPTAGPLPASIDALMRQNFRTALVNWPTFRVQFQIDA